MDLSEYRHTDGLRRWELLYEGSCLVLLNEQAAMPWRAELLAFQDLTLAWRLSPALGPERDHIQNVFIAGGKLYAGSFSGCRSEFDHRTGRILSKHFTR